MDSPRDTAKRGPSTPLSARLQNKRVFAAKTEPSPLHVTPSKHNAQLLAAKYESWLLRTQLDKQQALTAFLEVEREMAEPAQSI